MEKKPNMVKEAITTTIANNNIDTINTTQKSHAFNKTVDTSISNKYDKGESLYKFRYTQRTDTKNIVKTVNKSRSILRTSESNKSTKI